MQYLQCHPHSVNTGVVFKAKLQLLINVAKKRFQAETRSKIAKKRGRQSTKNVEHDKIWDDDDIASLIEHWAYEDVIFNVKNNAYHNKDEV